MADNKTYKVIVSDRAKQMPGTHIRSMAQVNKEAASDKKKEIVQSVSRCLELISDLWHRSIKMRPGTRKKRL
ncbi:plasmid stabilisation system protein [Clostridium sp. CAG:590]|nr:plasmid stabilisation system protein [Clostridium sp. CAG:590]